ncbi:hypothetical protein GCM10009617_14270 [Leifsonia poae]|uniref:Uncharacterized protein n=1 Tax=Leifsonia poae TaxID=110933 RepID=A0A9W6M0J2_9MICO|nr:hypothetical protein GCM10017584_30020 [Leifsonia poae]
MIATLRSSDDALSGVLIVTFGVAPNAPETVTAFDASPSFTLMHAVDAADADGDDDAVGLPELHAARPATTRPAARMERVLRTVDTFVIGGMP